MNAMHAILAATAMCAAPFVAGASDADPHASVPADLRQAAADFDRAQLHSDATELQRLLADDYVLYNSSGKVENKADFIRDYAGMKLQPFTVEDETIRVFGDAAVLAGVATLGGTDIASGEAFSVRLRFADVWRKRDGRWQVAFTQATRAASP
ncbi:nuclear transport factor 2 family protein [Pseudoluteimonas lycopersici]|uniref:Nuclear transport factor 2 family protein n=1 Tax=Pseudoluteimonas lycopersici TaxID=1324796 RepID=A0A516V2J0_9GAMM|nr:nuclear transport factor 2 family protein [Lysobacter lycopersici]QDQ72742.1 nuclear transport factor 2 family protein [Lysobacter lycopersici]